MELDTTFWELTNGLSDNEKSNSYAEASLMRLKKAFPFLLKHSDYLKFLETHGGLTLEPIEENSEMIIGTIWGIGDNVPHILDDEGNALENDFFHVADFYFYESKISFNFAIKASDKTTTFYLKINYPEDFKLTKFYEEYTACFSSFNSFLSAVLSDFEVLKTALLTGRITEFK
jgi:hypothetical protein